MKQNWVNTTLLAIIIGILSWGGNKGFEKMDMLNTASIETKMRLSSLESRISDVAVQLSLRVTLDQLKSELDKRDKTIDELKSELQYVKRHSIRP